MAQSSLFRWLGHSKSYPASRTPNLPDPNAQLTENNKRSFHAANTAVDDAVLSSPPPRKRRGSYHVYDSQTRAKIAKAVEEHGLSKACALLSKELGHSITVSTVQSIQNHYRRRLKEDGGDPDNVATVPTLHRGRLLLQGHDVDEQVLKYVEALRDVGGVVNRKIVTAAALGIVQLVHPSLLRENGFSLEIVGKGGRSWCESFLRRTNLVKRRPRSLPRNCPKISNR